ncbi:hypothetical protein [Prolixibacter sp. NT017]|uniref:hypothetical protein n=1 Tax=Prolixibacter sp. NT017 TaxID=2652390 RepID=UPI001298F2DF|nr:hypothetical protein [Prolixibacter sp. NT017]
MGYDKNGNITSLTRKNSGGSNRESLGYTYAGNRLSRIPVPTTESVTTAALVTTLTAI